MKEDLSVGKQMAEVVCEEGDRMFPLLPHKFPAEAFYMFPTQP
jgi:hypothetical protein